MNKDDIDFQYMMTEIDAKLDEEFKLDVPERIRLHIRDSQVETLMEKCQQRYLDIENRGDVRAPESIIALLK